MNAIVICESDNGFYGKNFFEFPKEDEFCSKRVKFLGLFSTLLLWSCPHCPALKYAVNVAKN